VGWFSVGYQGNSVLACGYEITGLYSLQRKLKARIPCRWLHEHRSVHNCLAASPERQSSSKLLQLSLYTLRNWHHSFTPLPTSNRTWKFNTADIKARHRLWTWASSIHFSHREPNCVKQLLMLFPRLLGLSCLRDFLTKILNDLPPYHSYMPNQSHCLKNQGVLCLIFHSCSW
jgi:hypothetical protein